MYLKLAELLEKDETVAVATVTEAKGSAPRDVGAKMIVRLSGQHVGTVGGGKSEAKVIEAAYSVLQTGIPVNVALDLTGRGAAEESGICGGVMNVYVEQWKSSDLLSPLLESLRHKRPVALVTVTRAEGRWEACLGRRAVVWSDQEPLGDLGLDELQEQVLADACGALNGRMHRMLKYATPAGDVEVFVEILQSPPALIIAGAGHIAVPLAQLGSICDFDVTVLDDRPEFANEQRFPTATEVVSAPFRQTMHQWVADERIDTDTYVVLITRGHQHDAECLAEVVHSPAAYIGMIGSRRRVRAVLQRLNEEQNIPMEKLQRVHAPIGIDIGAETPAEIAVSIMAEIVKVRRGGSARSLSD
ncbi:MAG TPA: XdhC/CoxI family protein [Anaerolineae bacterium]|nr:XdhC/CoxI family protein [Anaerolineae bacterium]